MVLPVDQTQKALVQDQEVRAGKELERKPVLWQLPFLRTFAQLWAKHRVATISVPRQHPDVARSDAGVRENCPLRVDNSWKE